MIRPTPGRSGAYPFANDLHPGAAHIHHKQQQQRRFAISTQHCRKFHNCTVFTFDSRCSNINTLEGVATANHNRMGDAQ
jgi:hypothetical protein